MPNIGELDIEYVAKFSRGRLNAHTRGLKWSLNGTLYEGVWKVSYTPEWDFLWLAWRMFLSAVRTYVRSLGRRLHDKTSE